MARRMFKWLALSVFLTQAVTCLTPAVADDLPFAVTQMGVCDYAVDKSETSKSLRSLYSCKQKVITIRNTSSKTRVFQNVVINQAKCKNHMFLDGDAGGPLKSGEKITFATSCKVSRIDLTVDRDDYYYIF